MPNIWLHLYSWFSSDTQIARYLKDTVQGNGEKTQQLDLYPNKLGNLNSSYIYESSRIETEQPEAGTAGGGKFSQFFGGYNKPQSSERNGPG